MTDGGAAAGTRLCMALVAAILCLNYTGAEGLIKWKWPVVAWQMYRAKAATDPVVRYRRLMAHDQDGTTRQTSDCGTLAYIEPNYRVDALLRTDAPRFLTKCLAALRSVQPTVAGVSLEVRSWSYDKDTLEQSLEHPPISAFRVAQLPAPLPSEPLQQDAGANLLGNAHFGRMDRKPGPPRRWQSATKWNAFGVDLPDGNRTGLIARAPGRKGRRYLEQKVELEPSASASRLRLSAWTHAVSEGAAIELDVHGVGRESLPVPFDGAWRRVELELEAPARSRRARATVRLSNGGRGDFFVDDVRLTAQPLP